MKAKGLKAHVQYPCQVYRHTTMRSELAPLAGVLQPVVGRPKVGSGLDMEPPSPGPNLCWCGWSWARAATLFLRLHVLACTARARGKPEERGGGSGKGGAGEQAEKTSVGHCTLHQVTSGEEG